MARICAVLVDVGGTLWPDGWPAQPGDGAQRRDRLRAAFPGLGPEQAAACVAELEEAGAQLPGTLTFLRAAAAAGVPPQACLMIGNSEDNDILPACSLGIRSLRVTIEEPAPAVSAASWIAGSLTEATRMLQALLAD